MMGRLRCLLQAAQLAGGQKRQSGDAEAEHQERAGFRAGDLRRGAADEKVNSEKAATGAVTAKKVEGGWRIENIETVVQPGEDGVWAVLSDTDVADTEGVEYGTGIGDGAAAAEIETVESEGSVDELEGGAVLIEFKGAAESSAGSEGARDIVGGGGIGAGDAGKQNEGRGEQRDGEDPNCG